MPLLKFTSVKTFTDHLINKVSSKRLDRIVWIKLGEHIPQTLNICDTDLSIFVNFVKCNVIIQAIELGDVQLASRGILKVRLISMMALIMLKVMMKILNVKMKMTMKLFPLIQWTQIPMILIFFMNHLNTEIILNIRNVTINALMNMFFLWSI